MTSADYEEFRQAPPTVPHLVLSPEEVGSKEVFVIGDVHGCYDELVEILETSGVRNNPNAIVILVGDLINKGPKSREVINLVREIGAYSVRGNHDQKMLNRRLKLAADKTYALEKKNEWILELSEDEVAFMSSLPYTISIPSLNAIIVHAGLMPNRPLTQDEPWDLMMMRNVIPEKTDEGVCYKAEKHHKPGEPWADVWPGPEHVFYGHDAKRGLRLSPHATGLDSGCVYGKSMTGVFLTGDKRIVQVKAHHVYSEPADDFDSK